VQVKNRERDKDKSGGIDLKLSSSFVQVELKTNTALKGKTKLALLERVCALCGHNDNQHVL